MTTTADDRTRVDVRSPGSRTGADADLAPDTPGAPRDRVDLGSFPVVHTRHWFRWTLAAIVLFLVAQFVWSVITNPNYEWDVFAHYFFAEPVLIGVGYTLALTAISAVIGFTLGTVLALGRLSKSPLLAAAS